MVKRHIYSIIEFLQYNANIHHGRDDKYTNTLTSKTMLISNHKLLNQANWRDWNPQDGAYTKGWEVRLEENNSNDERYPNKG